MTDSFSKGPVETHIGIIGLGAMGSAMARRLLQSGYAVTGVDVRAACIAELESLGGRGATTAREVASASDVVIISLNNVDAFRETTTGPEGLVHGVSRHAVVVDTCTLAIADKAHAAERLLARGVRFLDCTVSGNRNSILDGTLTLYASGDEAAYRRVEPVLAAISGSHTFLGAFGNASKLKFILNHLVTIHNAATAEAMALADRAGLDLGHVHALVTQSFAGSVVFRARGKMMLDGDYVSSRGTYGVARKDSRLIADFARDVLVPTPMFQAAVQMHIAGMAAGYTENDTASLFEVYKRSAGAECRPPQTPRIE
ncbi:MAG: NAD(P)-dependent oxidoreductase [Pseudomonadota bacterium]